MDSTHAILVLAALGQSTRLETFRHLIRKEPAGIPAGELARLMAVPQNTMSAHLAVLVRAGLVCGERQSRSIVYRADLARIQALIAYLLKDCCGGRADICAPLFDELMACGSKQGTCR